MPRRRQIAAEVAWSNGKPSDWGVSARLPWLTRISIAAREELMSALAACAGNTIIFVVGPTGVGKTTLRAKVEHDLTPD